MDRLTKRQNQIYQFIEKQIQAVGLPPTVREIARRFSIFPRAVQDHLAALERKGALKRVRDKARGLILTTPRLAANPLRIPILGRVPAGPPMEAIAEAEDFWSVDEAMARRAHFALRVKGDSMAPHILDGDLVLVKYSPVAENGDIVVASTLEHEATVKRFRRRGDEIVLEPANPGYPVLRGPGIRVVGVVTSLVRTYF